MPVHLSLSLSPSPSPCVCVCMCVEGNCLCMDNVHSFGCHIYTKSMFSLFTFVGEEEDESPFSSSPTRIHGTGSVGIKSEIDKDALDMGFNDIFGDLQSLAAEFEIPEQRKRRKSDASSRFASRKAPKPNQEIQHAFDEKPVMVKTSFNNADHYYSSIESIVDALQAIPGMDDVLFLDASKLLEDEKNAQMFVAMDVNQRRKWLLRKLRR